MSEIMLAKSYDESKLEFPVEVSIKLDGVAADFYKTPNGWLCQSRQGKPLPSTGHIVRWLNEYLPDADVNTHIIGELTVVDVPSFKEAAGVIRRLEEDERIILNAYDLYAVGRENVPYSQRKKHLVSTLQKLAKQAVRDREGVIYSIVKTVPVVGIINDMEELQQTFDSLQNLMKNSSLFEGYVIRNMDGKHSRYGIGKRSWGMMKYKPKPTLDLEVVGFEEATANKTMTFMGEEFHKGDGLRAVGRIKVLYHTGASSDGKNEYTDYEIIGVGPGCLTHEERRDLWERYEANGKQDLTGQGLIAEVEYMLDQNYDALRQPVFKRWRTDKDEPSQEA